ncbi:response regulator [Candidatus Woesearchaeota archaeon]|nr:response regulator [Candidatus Woesearchaeota archaeon]
MNEGDFMDKKKVLIIEDDRNILEAQAMILQSEFDVYKASNGDVGFALAKKTKPDLIVLDLMLPKRGGYDLCFSFRQEEELKNTKILMVTALGQEIDKKKGLMVGADHYMTKPFEVDEFLNKVRELI